MHLISQPKWKMHIHISNLVSDKKKRSSEGFSGEPRALACTLQDQVRPASWRFFPPLGAPWHWLLQQHLMQVVLILTWVLPALYVSYFCWTFWKFDILSLWTENRKEVSHKKSTRVVRCGIEDHVRIFLGTGSHQFFLLGCKNFIQKAKCDGEHSVSKDPYTTCRGFCLPLSLLAFSRTWDH